MDLVKKYAPIGAAAAAGMFAAEFVTKGRGTIVRVIGAVVGAGAGVLGGVKLGVVKL